MDLNQIFYWFYGPSMMVVAALGVMFFTRERRSTRK